MKNKRRKDILLELWEASLESYKKELVKKPDSLFYKGLVKNTEEFIKKIKRIK